MQVICMATTNTLNLVDNNDDTLSIVIVVIVLSLPLINGGNAEARPTRGGN